MNILITGVSSGLGLALVKEFANQGHNMIGCARDISKLKNLELKNSNNHLFTQVDVRNDNEVQQLANDVYYKFHKIDIIINNAGTKSKLSPTWEVSATDYAQVINTNILGVVNIIRHFVPEMVKNNSGSILNLTSEWGRYADAYVSSYCASKFAVEGLTQSLSKELPDQMSAIALNPYFVRTPLLESCKELFLPGEYELSISPEEWAEFAVPKILDFDRSSNGKSITLHPLANN